MKPKTKSTVPYKSLHYHYGVFTSKKKQDNAKIRNSKVSKYIDFLLSHTITTQVNLWPN